MGFGFLIVMMLISIERIISNLTICYSLTHPHPPTTHHFMTTHLEVIPRELQENLDQRMYRVTISAQMKKRTLKIFINSGYQPATGS